MCQDKKHCDVFSTQIFYLRCFISQANLRRAPFLKWQAASREKHLHLCNAEHTKKPEPSLKPETWLCPYLFTHEIFKIDFWSTALSDSSYLWANTAVCQLSGLNLAHSRTELLQNNPIPLLSKLCSQALFSLFILFDLVWSYLQHCKQKFSDEKNQIFKFTGL